MTGIAHTRFCFAKNVLLSGTTHTLPTTTPATSPAVRPPARRRKPRYLRIVGGLLLIALIVILYPPAFRYCVCRLAKIAAWRHGGKLAVERVSGSLFEAIRFDGVTLSSQPGEIVQVQMKIERLRASFSIRNLLFHRGEWLNELSLDGVDGAVTVVPPNGAGANEDATRRRHHSSPLRWMVPEKLDARRVEFIFRRRNESVRFAGVSFAASQSEPRLLLIREIEVQEPWLKKTFRNIRGTVAIQDESVSVSDATIEPGLILDSATADLDELVSGRLEMNFSVTGFGGVIRGEVKSNEQSGEWLAFDGSGSFSQISIADVAKFAGSEKKAGGIMREGKFSFHGSPRDWEKATFSTRLEATDFLWGERKWNAFTLGATLSGGRVQIPELHLRQAHNAISLTGEIDLPNAGTFWWQRDFTFNIAAKIDNLTELSALVGPRFGEMAGQLVIDGSVRGSHSSFNGQIIVSGSHLSYGSAPLDVLNAAIKLDGNELQISHVEFTHGEDYLRGQGVVNILGEEKRYWGEVRASVNDLALYAGFFQPPVAPRSFAGGLFLDWSGDGTAHAHSGAFRARLNNIRPLPMNDPALVPLDLEIAGSYSPEAIYFNRCRIAAGETAFSASVTANPESLHLEAIRLQNKNATWLEGDALLPLNVWTAWQNPGAKEAWNPGVPARVNLTARNLQLQTALRVTGRQWPVKGIVQGNITADGTLRAADFLGSVGLAKGDFSIGEISISNADADVSFEHQSVKVAKLDARVGGSEVKASGEIGLHDVANPALNLALEARGLAFASGNDLKFNADADLRLTGTAGAPTAAGSLKNVKAVFASRLDLAGILNPPLSSGALAGVSLSTAPFDRWNFDLRFDGEIALKINGAPKSVRSDLHVTGPGTALTASGTITFAGLTAASPIAPLTIADGLLALPVSAPPAVFLRGTATVSGTRIDVDVFGSLPNPTVLLEADPPLDQKSARELLSKGFISPAPGGDDSSLRLSVNPGVTDGLFK